MTLLCHSEFASVHFEHSGAWSSYHRCPPWAKLTGQGSHTSHGQSPIPADHSRTGSWVRVFPHVGDTWSQGWWPPFSLASPQRFYYLSIIYLLSVYHLSIYYLSIIHLSVYHLSVYLLSIYL
jgi:hypothetical protein